MPFTQTDLNAFGDTPLPSPLTMSQADLDAIRARWEATTTGTWLDQITEDGYLRVTTDLAAVNGICGFGDMEETDGQDHNNAEFVVHSHQDIPALLTEIEALRRACYHYVTQVGRWHERGKKR